MDFNSECAAVDLGLVGSSVVALADEVGGYHVATRYLRHFSAVKLRSGRPTS